MPDLANTLIGERYRLEHKLGAGGMGEVWAATDTRLARPVAVKILRSGTAADPAVRLRFESEARSAARLHHPNVVAVFDAGTDASAGETAQLWLVMERLPGETLVDSEKRGQLSPTEVRAVATDVLAGLTAAHQAKLVHRDIKPSNLLRAADGTWKIADFGIAKPLDTPADLTTTGATIGTPSYLSPEQLEGRPATPASDLWALGVVLYEALAGRKPFIGDTPFAVAHAVRSGEPQPISAIRPDVDPALSTTIAAALSKDPGHRPRDAATMAAMLGGAAPPTARIAAVLPTAPGDDRTPVTAFPAPLVAPPATAPPATARRSVLGWLMAGLILAAAVVPIALAATGSFSDDPPATPSTTTGPSTTAGSTSAPSSTTPGTTTATTAATSSTSQATTTTSTTSTTAPTTTTTTTSTTSTTAPTSTAPTTAPTTTAPTSTTKTKAPKETKATKATKSEATKSKA